MVHRLFVAPQCPNCARFIGALDRTPIASQVQRIDVSSLSPQQRAQVPAVPMLLLDSGATLVGSKAFEWLKQYEAGVELESYMAADGLGFSSIDDTNTFVTYAHAWSPFEKSG